MSSARAPAMPMGGRVFVASTLTGAARPCPQRTHILQRSIYIAQRRRCTHAAAARQASDHMRTVVRPPGPPPASACMCHAEAPMQRAQRCRAVRAGQGPARRSAAAPPPASHQAGPLLRPCHHPRARPLQDRDHPVARPFDDPHNTPPPRPPSPATSTIASSSDLELGSDAFSGGTLETPAQQARHHDERLHQQDLAREAYQVSGRGALRRQPFWRHSREGVGGP